MRSFFGIGLADAQPIPFSVGCAVLAERQPLRIASRQA
jgi:hypothetical protein